MQNAFRAQISVPTKEYAHSRFMEPVSESESAERNVQNVHGEGGCTLVRTSTMIIPPPTARTRDRVPSTPSDRDQDRVPPSLDTTRYGQDTPRAEGGCILVRTSTMITTPSPPGPGPGQGTPHPTPGQDQDRVPPSPDTTRYGQDTPQAVTQEDFLVCKRFCAFFKLGVWGPLRVPQVNILTFS